MVMIIGSVIIIIICCINSWRWALKFKKTKQREALIMYSIFMLATILSIIMLVIMTKQYEMINNMLTTGEEVLTVQ